MVRIQLQQNFMGKNFDHKKISRRVTKRISKMRSKKISKRPL